MPAAVDLTLASVICRVTQTRSFDTELASSSYATGFVVDKQRGLILTNRHVVTPGIVTADTVEQFVSYSL